VGFWEGGAVTRLVPFVLLVALSAGCAGSSEFERCVQHSVEEGLDRAVVEQACREAGREE
jgi:hypothetical protein